MSQHDHSDDPRLFELLADRAAFGLSPQEQAELERLLAATGRNDDESFERAAAVIELAQLASARRGHLTDLPANLRARIAADAAQHLGGKPGESDVRPASPRPVAPQVERRDLLAWLGWAVAAALLLMVGWQASRYPSVEPSVAESYRRMVASNSPEVLRAAWIDPTKPDDKRARGDLVWDNRQQRGYMRFQTLPVNDPKKEQYQLWIFDSAQDERYPIDGGVFDISAAKRDSATGGYIVPVRAKLHVEDPTMFAITIEKPGGVVVSNRERLPLLAKVP